MTGWLKSNGIKVGKLVDAKYIPSQTSGPLHFPHAGEFVKVHHVF
jgi:hypothetical protein